MLDENLCKNSGGWFRDPNTGEDITGDYPREITCKSGMKWVQPQVKLSNGSIVKISGRCWNKDERECYKEYRSHSTPREQKPVEQKPKINIVKEESSAKYNPESTTSHDAEEIIAMCNQYCGTSFIAGIVYALLSIKGKKVIYHIPRQLIPDAEIIRLSNMEV